MSTPSVPPRPQRTQAGHTAVKNDIPSIPPRPTRKTDPSPDREAYGRSPLNGPPVSIHSKPVRPASGRNSEELPRRPPSVSIPDVGHEGEEYSSFDYLPAEAHGVDTAKSEAAADEQTKSVSADLPMHQPRASVPQSTARRQIQTVTSTDSTQAAAAGIGRSRPADDVHKLPPHDARTESPLSRVTSNTHEPRRAPSAELGNPLRTKASFNRSTPSLNPLERTTSRPGSVHGGEDREYGIPEIGVQVPLLAMAGDVQAPTPQPGQTQHTPGIGFFNDGSARNHHRKRSSRHEFGPPDSYGIRHDQDHQDQFEREWARKHPQEAAREELQAHLPKPETALSSDQLNRLVSAGPTGPSATPGTPDEHEAEEYLSRISSAAPSPALGERKKRASSGSQTKAESPLRKTNFAFNDKNRLHPDDALEDEPSPFTRGGNSYIEDDHEHEHADGTPILAADELMKRPSSAFMHAAVVPDPDSHYDEYYDSDTARNSRRGSAQPPSRPSSRPNSVHGSMQGYSGGSLHRFISHEETHHSGVGTPLEEIEEYEPLFPEDEGKGQTSPKKVFKKRSELAQHHFPSRDVWEDTPDSLQYSTTVSTPELERTQQAVEADRGAAKATFETPAEEAQRRQQNDKENDMTSDSKTFIKPQFKSAVLEDIHRPGAHRFPSSDVWEDSPDSVRLVTTVSSPQMDDARSPPDDRPSTYALPGSQDDDEARATTGFSQAIRPSIPSRPQRSSKLGEEVKPSEIESQRAAGAKSPPSIPEKPKVPARPARPAKVGDGVTAEEAVAAVKAKPPVPARPGGEKIAALKAGFMNDLNNRLKLGPQGPPPKKEPEAEPAEEEQKAPLADARKSRAKGPARRKPATSPVHDRKSSVTFAMSPLINMWSIDEEDELRVHEKEAAKAAEAEAQEAEKVLAQNEVHNTESAAPSEDVAVEDVATKISTADQPGEVAREHRSSELELKAALAAAGAAPSSYAEESISETSKDAPAQSAHDTQASEETKPADSEITKDTAVQTGETDVTTTLPSGEQEKMTAFLGAKVPEEGDVIVKDGKEVQS
ncbi:hypothetical protein PRZ48_014985 [Zasmidium cellare]|uniref:Altered inheritance of mitochondria protein 21 n=1 Tax=Zasmidium cellare TaxID=395010 RepID=A0ABR0DXB6_ZASCE|nr:hypothetical protein PRZ48_014985 [Zasmidium cellare]